MEEWLVETLWDTKPHHEGKYYMKKETTNIVIIYLYLFSYVGKHHE